MPSERVLPPDAAYRPWAEWAVRIGLAPHSLGLDAAAVALCWQALLARHAGLALGLAERVVLPLTVWIIYAADRLLDTRGWRSEPSAARHRLLWSHRTAAVATLCAAALADLLLTAAAVPRAVWPQGLALAAAVLAYLAAVHLTAFRRGVAKAALVAALFTAGVFLAPWSAAGSRTGLLHGPAVAFFLLCLSNLLIIDAWERPEAVEPAFARVWVPLVPALLAACCAGFAQPWPRSIAISAALMLVLYGTGRRIALDARRALVDAALLAPLLFLLG